MVIKETTIFTRSIQALMPDDQYAKLQKALVDHPNAGDVIRGSGGLRKLRWNLPEKGKRGGVRVIYYHIDSEQQIYMIFAYKKSDQEDLTADQLRQLKLIVSEELKQ